jgi:signal transduction histidine kinase
MFVETLCFCRAPDVTRKGEAPAHQFCKHHYMSLDTCPIALLPAAFSSAGDAFLPEAQRSVHNVDLVLELGLGAISSQSRWFYLLVGVFLVVVLWIAHRFRLGVLTDQVHNLLAERLSERERISRGLSDTLLQGMQGLILLFQGVAAQIPSETPLASKLETALDRAERLLVEGRDSVRDLRAPNFNLPDALRSLNAEQRPPGTEYSVEVSGHERELELLVSDEFFKIAREAIVKALQHASADHVWVTLKYRPTSLALIVIDDGRDVSGDFSEDGISGRWGLSGMKSRARKLEGKLLISNRSPTGTEVRLTVPANVAYRAHVFFVVEWLRSVVDFLRRRGPRR